jgi:hypothetical protein
MAGKTAKSEAATGNPGGAALSLKGYWADQIDRALRRFQPFHADGRLVVQRYRLQKRQSRVYYQGKYNILYSSTETMKPSLYAQQPRVETKIRHKDRGNPVALGAAMLMESVGQYTIEEVDFDSVMNNVVEDYLLPGLAQAWVRYDPVFTTKKGDDGKDYEELAYEGIGLDYVYWEDFLSDEARVWEEKEWNARRCYFSKKKATKRFGSEKADKLAYTYRSADRTGKTEEMSTGVAGEQAIIYEIWDKPNKRVIWYSPDYPENDVLDVKNDPLKLKNFWPCPKPLRAVSTTSEFIPQAYYSEYKEQAETLDDITRRIRILTKALKVVGVYDASNANLARILTGDDNQMVPVQNWAAFTGQNGLQGSVQYLPIKDVAGVLTELYRQREIAKNEIYEITGFSDIVRGVSKASETLGAQEIKNNWATGRLRLAQKEVQRFCRDLIRIMVEIASEHFSTETLALYAGFDPPEVTAEEQQAAGQYAAQMLAWQQLGGQASGQPAPQPPVTKSQQAQQQFNEVVDLLRREKERCALVGIETDSTVQPDEIQERKDRLEFLGQAGAFLQQAAPLAQQYPPMAQLLGEMLMFGVRSFRSSRPLEKAFEDFTKSMQANPPQPQQGGEGENGSDPAAAQAQVQSEQIKAQQQQQSDQAKNQMEKYKADLQASIDRERMQMEHEYRMQQLNIEQEKLRQNEQKMMLEAQRTAQQEQRADVQQQHDQFMDVDGAERNDRQFDQQQATQRAAAAAKPVAKKPKAKD